MAPPVSSCRKILGKISLPKAEYMYFIIKRLFYAWDNFSCYASEFEEIVRKIPEDLKED